MSLVRKIAPIGLISLGLATAGISVIDMQDSYRKNSALISDALSVNPQASRLNDALISLRYNRDLEKVDDLAANVLENYTPESVETLRQIEIINQEHRDSVDRKIMGLIGGITYFVIGGSIYPSRRR